MKKLWQKISIRIDSRTLRERTLMFGMIAGVIIFLVFALFLNPTYAKHKMLLADLNAQQTKIATVEAEITQTLLAFSADPDAAERAQLLKVQTDVAAMRNSLMAMERGMVPASRMTALLGTILQSHRGLRLKSMRTLGETPAMSVPVAGAPVAALPSAGVVVTPSGVPVPAPGVPLLHKHGFELVVEGNYSDMVAYMTALENMQGTLLWGSSRLDASAYPKATLTLVVYTVNLDKKWIKL